MVKLIIAPIAVALALYLFVEFYKFSSDEEKTAFVRGSFKAVVFLSIAILLLTAFVVLF